MSVSVSMRSIVISRCQSHFCGIRWASTRIGIVGLPNIGKSTLFNALTHGGAEAANYPFCTIEPNVGMSIVKDSNLMRVQKYRPSKKLISAAMNVVDIAGIIRGASEGQGLGNMFLSHIAEVDALMHVVRCFEDPNVTHVDGNLSVSRDVETINMELIFRDLQTLDSAAKKNKSKRRDASSIDPELRSLAIEKLKECLEAEKPARVFLQSLNDSAESTAINEVALSLRLLSMKPVLYVGNVDEEQAADISAGSPSPLYDSLVEIAKSTGATVAPVCAKTEADLLSLPSEEERKELLEVLGMSEPGTAVLSRLAYDALGLQSFYTAGPEEIRAWTVRVGATAQEAAAVIHTDIAKALIKTEVYTVTELEKAGSEAELRKLGKLRAEGKGYLMQKDDIVHFMHSAK